MKSTTETKAKRATLKGTQPFRVVEFKNPSGASVWRVTGILTSGERVRKNFKDQCAALAYRTDLERDAHGWASELVPRLTRLSDEQLRAAEYVFSVVESPDEAGRAIDWWRRQGKAMAGIQGEAVKLSVAAERFLAWVAGASHLSRRYKLSLKSRITRFVAAVPDCDITAVTPETIETWLDGQSTQAISKDMDRVGLCRFFVWCIARPQRYVVHNPAKEVKVHRPARGLPQVYTVDQIRRVLSAARTFDGGRWLRYIVLQVFAGLRPGEALKMQNREINLADGEVTVLPETSKKRRPRHVKLEPCAVAWLKVCPDCVTVDTANSYPLWLELRDAAGLAAWIPDGFRHTAISMLFRVNGSYGFTAEWAGNSESIIKRHYQGRVSSADAAAFWALTPDKLSEAPSNIVPAQFVDGAGAETVSL